jgi:hypothetical protein
MPEVVGLVVERLVYLGKILLLLLIYKDLASTFRRLNLSFRLELVKGVIPPFRNVVFTNALRPSPHTVVDFSCWRKVCCHASAASVGIFLEAGMMDRAKRLSAENVQRWRRGWIEAGLQCGAFRSALY